MKVDYQRLVYDFSNLGIPEYISNFTNKMVREFRENGKVLFVKTKYQESSNQQLLIFNSSSIANKIIVVFDKAGKSKVQDTIEVIIKRERPPSICNFTKPKKIKETFKFSLKSDEKELLDLISGNLWLDINEKKKPTTYPCRLGMDGFVPQPDTLVVDRILSYRIIDPEVIEITLEGKTKNWTYYISPAKVVAFALINDLPGMWLVVSPDGDYKIIIDIKQAGVDLY